jgi:aerobic carbon-monoxide dehydrogenase large subunit
VKWIEDRMDNLMATAFARDYWMKGRISATKEGKITALHCHVTADHGAFDACADPTKFPAGFFHICTGSYDIPVAYVGVDGVYTNKAPGGVAYRCSFRVTEAAYFIERMIEVLAIELNMDAAELRRINFIRKDQFPYQSALGWEYDSGDYHTAWDKALAAVDYPGLRAEQAQRLEDFKAGKTRKLIGIGLSHFTEIVGAGRSRTATSSGWACSTAAKSGSTPPAAPSRGWARSARGRATRRPSRRSSPVEIGLPADSITIEEGDTDTAPYGLGTYGSRSTPVAGAAAALVGRKIRAKAQMIAAYLLEVHDGDLEWDVDRFVVKGAPERFKTMKEIAYRRLQPGDPGAGAGAGGGQLLRPAEHDLPLRRLHRVMEIDADTGEHEVRQFYALDDCGTRINPMVIEGQVHGGRPKAMPSRWGRRSPTTRSATSRPAR